MNIRKGGTLTVLRDCLRYLSSQPQWHVTALVHDRMLCDYPGIHYVEIPWSVKGWGRRLWCEYVTMKRISRRLPDTDLWFSLHDTTPRVKAGRQAVYCHTSFPFMKPAARDIWMDAKIPLFTLLTRFAYQINVKKNAYLVVQADWMRNGLSRLIRFPKERIIVSPPAFSAPSLQDSSAAEACPIFLYPSTPDCHKNFETLCMAARQLEIRGWEGRFKVVITMKGTENRYAQWLKDRYGKLRSVDFHGFMAKEELYAYYEKSACLVFPSRIETWGLPISEFLPLGKPMILADLPYAHETAAGARKVAFFDVKDVFSLALRMEEVIKGEWGRWGDVESSRPQEPFADGWDSLFQNLLD